MKCSRFARSRLLLIGFCWSAALSVYGQDMEATFVDAAWTGEGIPQGQQCQRFGGENPESPAVQLHNVPESAEAIVLEFSDRSFVRMDKGGHGKVGYKIESGQSEVVVSPVQGHREELPEPFFVVQLHQAPGWDKAGAYLPPCSGGRGNEYFIDIKAVTLRDDQSVGTVLAQTSIQMATY
ncbi:hypothetical protein ACXYTJ_05540 [Gilvimarinus sp. F26214L]|uniref:hypothetical protein n=1 Tax=Gilvimarinus sp. DZF01 TaxID=3461371 RepID=UPI004045251B